MSTRFDFLRFSGKGTFNKKGNLLDFFIEGFLFILCFSFCLNIALFLR